MCPRAPRAEREQRPPDCAEVVHGSFEAVCASVGGGRDDISEQRISGGNAEASSGPGASSEDADLPGCGCDADDGGKNAVAVYPPRALARRRSGSSASAPPAKRATPAPPSAIPSIRPSAAAGCPKRRGEKAQERSAVGTSCPRSARKLAPPMPATPRVSQDLRSTVSVTASRIDR